MPGPLRLRQQSRLQSCHDRRRRARRANSVRQARAQTGITGLWLAICSRPRSPSTLRRARPSRIRWSSLLPFRFGAAPVGGGVADHPEALGSISAVHDVAPPGAVVEVPLDGLLKPGLKGFESMPSKLPLEFGVIDRISAVVSRTVGHKSNAAAA